MRKKINESLRKRAEKKRLKEEERKRKSLEKKLAKKTLQEKETPIEENPEPEIAETLPPTKNSLREMQEAEANTPQATVSNDQEKLLIGRYKNGVKIFIQKNTEPLINGFPKELVAEFNIKTEENGQITKVILSKSSGNKEFDRLVEIGIRKSSPLPVPKGKDSKFYQLGEFYDINLNYEAILK